MMRETRSFLKYVAKHLGGMAIGAIAKRYPGVMRMIDEAQHERDMRRLAKELREDRSMWGFRRPARRR